MKLRNIFEITFLYQPNHLTIMIRSTLNRFSRKFSDTKFKAQNIAKEHTFIIGLWNFFIDSNLKYFDLGNNKMQLYMT